MVRENPLGFTVRRPGHFDLPHFTSVDKHGHDGREVTRSHRSALVRDRRRYSMVQPNSSDASVSWSTNATARLRNTANSNVGDSSSSQKCTLMCEAMVRAVPPGGN